MTNFLLGLLVGWLVSSAGVLIVLALVRAAKREDEV